MQYFAAILIFFGVIGLINNLKLRSINNELRNEMNNDEFSEALKPQTEYINSMLLMSIGSLGLGIFLIIR